MFFVYATGPHDLARLRLILKTLKSFSPLDVCPSNCNLYGYLRYQPLWGLLPRPPVNTYEVPLCTPSGTSELLVIEFLLVWEGGIFFHPRPQPCITTFN